MKTKITFTLVISLICTGLFSWTWPLSNSNSPDDADTFTSPFGPRWLGYYDFHEGMDLQASEGTPVYAAHSGWVHASYGHSGIYFYKLNVNGKTEAVKKCLLLK